MFCYLQDEASQSKPKIINPYMPDNGPCVRWIHNEFDEFERNASDDISYTMMVMAVPTALIATVYGMV